MKNVKGVKTRISEKLPQKTITIFEAVLKLRDEGTDLNNLTVAKIAKKAGIGKGTIYDYLSSKEEIIVKALAYEYCLQVYEFSQSVKAENTFEEQIEVIFKWVEDNMKKSFFLLHFVKADQMLGKMGYEFCEELFPNISKAQVFNDTVDYVLSTGANEKKIRPPKDNLERDMIMNAIGGALFTAVISQEKYNVTQCEQVKRYAREFLFSLLTLG